VSKKPPVPMFDPECSIFIRHINLLQVYSPYGLLKNVANNLFLDYVYIYYYMHIKQSL